MSTRAGKSAIDRARAERLLRGGRDGGDHRLASLLAAAKAPGRGDELAKEEMIVAAFRAARRDSVSQTQRRSMIKTALMKLLTVKVAALTAAAAGVGGVALAASAGTIPSPLHANGSGSSHSPAAKARPSDHPSGRPSRATVPSGMPPGLYWLCNDYIGRDASHRGKALGESKFRELVDKAGGRDRDKADKFCDKLLNGRGNGAQNGSSNHGQGNGATSHPTGPPARTKNPVKPSKAARSPANRPSDRPSTHPDR